MFKRESQAVRDARSFAEETNLALRMELRFEERRARRAGDDALASSLRDQRERAKQELGITRRMGDAVAIRAAGDDWQERMAVLADRREASRATGNRG